MGRSNRLIILSNFDGTTFDTFAQSPSGNGVHEAYEKAIRDRYGDEGLVAYAKLGGLQNREPGQLFDLLTRELGIEVPSITVRKKGIEALVDAKLSYMVGDISPAWPKPYPGVVKFFKAIEKGKLPVLFGIASSGHTKFIQRVYEVNGLRPPKIMITSDDINALVEPKRPLYRPNTHMIARLHHRMRKELGEDEEFFTVSKTFLGRGDWLKRHAVFIGDHPTIDGGVAERARMLFGFVPFRHPDFVPQPEKGQILIPDFSVLHQWLEEHRENIEGGMSASELFLGVPDEILFPDVAESERPFNLWLRTMREGNLGAAEPTGFPITPITRGKEAV